MRAHHGITVVTMILAGFGLKLAFFTDPTVAADVSAQRAAIDISGMHRHIKNLPVENFHDMTFVISNGG
jgi:hypothetical protein